MKTERDTVVAGRYRLTRPAGGGGMGAVWEAHDRQLDRRVAIKLPEPHLAADEGFVERFRREARAAARLSHPNVAQVFDYGVDRGRPYLVMEFVEGETLAHRLERQDRLPEEEARRIAIGMADALQAAHDAGIVHRDVKPGNVMLTPTGGVKMLDFGVAAAAADGRMTTSGVIMGTPAYLAPERAKGQPATAASDVYSLGVVLYEMLSGRPPFGGDSPVAIASAHVHGDPQALEEVVPSVDPSLARAARAAMEKDPARRPSSASDLAAMLGGATEAPAAPAGTAVGGTTQVLPRDRTERLPTGAVPVGAPPTPPEPTPVPARSTGRGRRALIAAVLAAVALALVLFLMVNTIASNRPGPALSPSAPTTSHRTQPQSQPPSSPSPSTSPSPSHSPPTTAPPTTAPPTTAPPTTAPPTTPSSPISTTSAPAPSLSVGAG